MSHPDVGPERRLYGMMQYLMRHAGHHRPPGTPSALGVVTLQDALDAVLQVAAVIEDQVHAAHLPVERGVHAAAMLMTIRDFVQPLPRGLADEGVTDRVTADLAELVAGPPPRPGTPRHGVRPTPPPPRSRAPHPHR